MAKTVVVTQSNYLPWKGYFDQIRQADLLVLLDCVQYTRRDWRNRNQIKTADGPRWISIPVKVKGRYFQPIDETEIAEPGWADQHTRVLEANYRRASAFGEEGPWLFEQLRAAAGDTQLSRVNRRLLEAICRRVGIKTPIVACDDLLPRDELVAMEPTERLLRLCQACGATRYVCGPAAKAYLDVEAFHSAGIEVAWFDYAGYPEYPQLQPPFVHGVSIVDLLLNVGAKDALRYMERRNDSEGVFNGEPERH